jgi:hypothetical protein
MNNEIIKLNVEAMKTDKHEVEILEAELREGSDHSDKKGQTRTLRTTTNSLLNQYTSTMKNPYHRPAPAGVSPHHYDVNIPLRRHF